MKTEIIPAEYLEWYKKNQPITISKHFANLKKRAENFEIHYGKSLTEAIVFSSMIEGNPIDLDSYVKYTQSGTNTGTKPYKEIAGLKKMYGFAKKHKLNKKNILIAHQLLTESMAEIADENKGVIRKANVNVVANGEIIYFACDKKHVNQEIDKFFRDLILLVKQDLNINESFYFASMIHLVFVHIHPFVEGNGRTARLLEKWFLAEKLGNNAWLIGSEKLYHKRIRSYYKNLDLGKDYEHINYDLSTPFLKMLPMALTMDRAGIHD